MKEKQMKAGININKTFRGTIICEGCKQVLGYLSQDCKKVYLHILCKCGSSGYLISGEFDDRIVENADLLDNEIYCSVCGSKLLSVSPRVKSLGFKIECNCGHAFDRTYIRKRELYSDEN